MKPCKIWTGRINENGYGRDGQGRYVHIVACEKQNGLRPPGTEASHLCCNKLCYEQEHMAWETKSENEMRKPAHVRKRASQFASAVATEKQVGSGKGWRYDKRCPGKPYRAEARVNGKLKFLGGFPTQVEAETAYRQFSEQRGHSGS